MSTQGQEDVASRANIMADMLTAGDRIRYGDDAALLRELAAEITRLRSENERLLASMRIVRNDLAALVPVPSADEPQWPEFFSAADYQCLTLALREARAAVELSKEPSNG